MNNKIKENYIKLILNMNPNIFMTLTFPKYISNKPISSDRINAVNLLFHYINTELYTKYYKNLNLFIKGVAILEGKQDVLPYHYHMLLCTNHHIEAFRNIVYAKLPKIKQYKGSKYRMFYEKSINIQPIDNKIHFIENDESKPICIEHNLQRLTDYCLKGITPLESNYDNISIIGVHGIDHTNNTYTEFHVA